MDITFCGKIINYNNELLTNILKVSWNYQHYMGGGSPRLKTWQMICGALAQEFVYDHHEFF